MACIMISIKTIQSLQGLFWRHWLTMHIHSYCMPPSIRWVLL